MNVLIITYEYPPIGGGTGRALKKFVEHFRSDINLHVLTVSPDTEDWSDVVRNHEVIRIALKRDGRPWEKGYWWQWYRKTASIRLLDPMKYDIIHFWGGMPGLFLPFSKRVPYIVSLRGSDVPGFNKSLDRFYKLTGWWYKKAWRGAAAVTSLSPGLTKMAQDFCCVPIMEIPNGCCKPFRNVGPLGGTVNLVTSGRLIGRKRIGAIIRAADSLYKAGTKVSLRIVGDGPMKDEIRKQADVVSVPIKMTGWIGMNYLAYNGMNIYVHAAEAEGMANTILEAMEWGLPVVAVDSPGSEFVKQFGVSVSDEYSLVDGVKKAVMDYDRLAKQSTKMAEEMSWDKIAKEYEKIYQSL